MVFYRKYRPQKIEDLDSEEIRERLFSVLGTEAVPHAFLFTGPKGLGKTSAARILAKAINCEGQNQESGIKNKGKNEKKDKLHNSKGVEPCNQCSQCISITNGTNLDVFEIDGASNRGIDEIRDIKEKLNLSAQTLTSKKIYIIDEVHMLTTEAFNALLKTLEEPPSHVIFILCTTEPAKIPQTIVSRCFHITFRKASKQELIRSFERIVKGEHIQIDREGLDFIADLADGGFRDGAKILEEFVQTAKGTKITKKMLEEKYHLSDSKSLALKLLKFLQDRDVKEALKIISGLEKEGLDIKRFIQDILAILHETLLFSAGASDTQTALKLELADISSMAELFTKAYSDVKYSVLPQLPLEIAVVKYIRLKRASSASLGDSFLLASELAASNADSNIHLTRSYKLPSSPLSLLQELIEKSKVHNHSLSGLLRGCSLISFDNDKLVLGTKFKFHKQKLEDGKNLKLLQKICEDTLGKKIEILIELKEK